MTYSFVDSTGNVQKLKSRNLDKALLKVYGTDGVLMSDGKEICRLRRENHYQVYLEPMVELTDEEFNMICSSRTLRDAMVRSIMADGKVVKAEYGRDEHDKMAHIRVRSKRHLYELSLPCGRLQFKNNKPVDLIAQHPTTYLVRLS